MAQTKEPEKKKEKSTVIAFSGTGWGLLGYALFLVVSAALVLIPLPFVTVGLRKWFYRNLVIINSADPAKRVELSFDGSPVGLMKYWLPSLGLLAISGVSLFYGIAGKVDGFMTFLLVVISIVALFPQAWLWTAKRRYVVSHTKVLADGVPVTLTFDGQGSTALWHGMKMIFSIFVVCLPLPWALVNAVQWCLEKTEIAGKTIMKPTFSGKGGSLFWYGIGLLISPFFLFLILPSLIRGLMAWMARYVNIIGIEKTIEFEFTGTAGRLFGYVYLFLGLCLAGIIVNYLLGGTVSEPVRFILVSLVFVVTLPFVVTSFLRWCMANLDTVKK